MTTSNITNTNSITETLRAAQKGSRKIRITFKKTAISDTIYLSGMENSKIIAIDPSDKVVLMAVRESNNWEYDDNRIVNIILTPAYDNGGEEWFLGRMRRALEKIELV